VFESELQYIIHFFNDKKYLFKTITMENEETIDEVSDAILLNKGWYSHRYGKSDRYDYIKRRKFIEKELYIEYVSEYGSLKENIPVYFYLHPNITREIAIELARQRTKYNEFAPMVLFMNIRELKDITNITFTLNDSFTSYWKKAIESGIKCREEENGREILPDHNKIFPLSMIEQIHGKYKDKHPYYEIQIWDYKILDNVQYEIL
jgi:hypothetical protein